MEVLSYSRYRKYYQSLGPILKTPQARAYTMAILSFLTLSILGAFFIRPAIRQIFELNRKITDRQLVSQKLAGKIKNLETAKGEYRKIQKDFPLILAALPLKSDFPPFLKTLEKTSSDSAVALTALKFQDITLLEPPATPSAQDQKLPDPQTLAFSLGSSGSYANLFSFLKALEKEKRLVNIGEFNMMPQTEGTVSAELTLSLKNYIYFLSHNLHNIEE